MHASLRFRSAMRVAMPYRPARSQGCRIVFVIAEAISGCRTLVRLGRDSISWRLANHNFTRVLSSATFFDPSAKILHLKSEAGFHAVKKHSEGRESSQATRICLGHRTANKVYVCTLVRDGNREARFNEGASRFLKDDNVVRTVAVEQQVNTGVFGKPHCGCQLLGNTHSPI